MLFIGRNIGLTIYTKDIVAFGMYQYLGESRSREQINQLLRTIPTVKSDWELSQVNAFLLKEIKHFTKHISEYVGFGCVSSALFTDRSDIKRNDPLTNLDGYGNDVLTMNGLVMFAIKPVVCETDEFAQSAYDSIINVDSDPHSGESCWAFNDSVFNHFGCCMTSDREQEFPGQKDAPGFDSSIYLVFVNTQGLRQLVRSEYIEDMSRSQHQQYLDSILSINSEYGGEKLLKKCNGLSNLFYHGRLLVSIFI
jgi:hypothetical protein